MKISKQLLIFSLLATCLAAACRKETPNIDTVYPEIVQTPDGFPRQCSELTRGQTFVFRARFSDNAELGSFSLDIHHNFDHHTHSTDGGNDCGLDPVKIPVNPFLLIRGFQIPAGQREYSATAEFQVPADVDPGDYHFMIRLTDKAGWQTISGLSIKIN